MIPRVAIILLAIHLALPLSISVAERQIKEKVSANSFGYKSALIGMSVGEFKDYYPKVELKIDPAIRSCLKGVIVNHVGYTSFEFLDGKLCTMVILFSKIEVNQLGGNDGIVRKLSNVFGEPKHEKIGAIDIFTWDFAPINRSLTFFPDEVIPGLHIYDNRASNWLANARK